MSFQNPWQGSQTILFGFLIFLGSKYSFALPLPLPAPPSTPSLILKHFQRLPVQTLFYQCIIYTWDWNLCAEFWVLNFFKKNKTTNLPWHKSWGIVKFLLNRQTHDEKWKAQLKEIKKNKTKQNLELQLLLAGIAVSRTQTPPSSPSQGACLETSPEHCGAFNERKQKVWLKWYRTAQLPTSSIAGSVVSLTQREGRWW